MRRIGVLAASAVLAACTADRGVAPEAQPEIVRAPTECRQDAPCARPMLIVDGKESDLTLFELAGADIAAVEVMRGSIATRQYGARAQHGVIIVTTKTGRGIDKRD